MRVLVFDTETGGLDTTKHSVFSVGALVGDLATGEIIDQFEAYHKLDSIGDYVYTPKAIEIHSITPQDAFTNGLPTDEIRDRFMDLWTMHSATIIGGHNVDYDVRMMSNGIFNCSIQQFEANLTYRKLDSLPLTRMISGTALIKSGASLGQAIKTLKIDMSEFGKNKFHAALFDSICSFKVMCRFYQLFMQPDIIERLQKDELSV